MRTPNCDECQRLWHEYAQATTAHIKLEGKLRLAALAHEHETIPALTIQAEGAGVLRASLREAIRKHDLAHDGWSATSPKPCCETRRMLADAFAIAARLYAEAVVIQTGTRCSGPEFEELCGRVREALERAEAAQLSFEEHVRSHSCGVLGNELVPKK